MIRKKYLGSIHIPLLIVVALWLLSTFAFYYLYVDWQRLVQDAKQNNIRRDDLESNPGRALLREAQEVESLVGFFVKGEIKVKLMDPEEKNGLGDKLNEINSDQKTGDTKVVLGLSDLIGQEIRQETLSEPNLFHLENVLESFQKRIVELQNELAIHHQATENTSGLTASLLKQRREIEEAKNQEMQKLVAQEEALTKKLDERLSELRENTRLSKENKVENEQRRAQIESEIAQQKVHYENLISKKKTEIRQMQAAKYGRTTYTEVTKERGFEPQEEPADGEIIFADFRNKLVYISLGKEHNMLKGLKFDVYRPAEAGEKRSVGRIEIQQVMDGMSKAVITHLQNPLDPIVSTDLIINPVFAKERGMYFAFAGKFVKWVGDGNARAKQLIESLGGKVEDSVTARTDFVVFGGPKGPEHKNYAAAVNLGIPLMTEDILLQYIGD